MITKFSKKISIYCLQSMMLVLYQTDFMLFSINETMSKSISVTLIEIKKTSKVSLLSIFF